MQRRRPAQAEGQPLPAARTRARAGTGSRGEEPWRTRMAGSTREQISGLRREGAVGDHGSGQGGCRGGRNEEIGRRRRARSPVASAFARGHLYCLIFFFFAGF